MKTPFLPALASLALVLAAPLAQADSAASAILSFNVVSTSGFTWLTTPESSADSAATAVAMNGFSLAADVFNPNYGAAATDSALVLGTAVPAATAGTSAGDVFANAFTSGNARFATLSANALVPVDGKAEAASFARSWFSLSAGASVTFQGALSLSVTGTNPALPASYSTGDFFSYATGLLAVGSDEAMRELGGPASTGMAGSYSLNDFGALSLTVTNTTGDTFTTYLDSGVAVYSASPVPEPGTYALLLAGLVGVVFISRRQSLRR
jgi:PEP-CTERM motif